MGLLIFVEHHLVDIGVLAVAAGLVALRPRFAPYLAVLAVLLPSTATRVLTSEGLVLAGVMLGLVIDRLRRRNWTLGPVLTGPLVLLGALDALMLLSLLANHAEPQATAAASSTAYFVTRTVLVAVVVVLSVPTPVTRLDWLMAGAAGAAVVAGARVLALAGLPVQSAVGDHLSIRMMGDVGQFGTWNVYELVVVVGAFLALAAADLIANPRRADVMRALALLMLAAAGTAGSRTALIASVLVLAVLALFAVQWRRRALLAAMALSILLTSLFSAVSVLSKPLLVSTNAGVAARPAARPTATPAPIRARSTVGSPARSSYRPPSGLSPTWRVLLNKPFYRFEQTFTHPTLRQHGNYVVLMARAAGMSPEVRLEVTVNGVRLAQLRESDVKTVYRWIEVPIPDAVVAGSSGGNVTVGLTAVGRLDSQTRYFAVGAIDAAAPVITARAFSNGRLVPGDLSPDPGRQQGMGLVLLNGQVPSLHHLTRNKATAVDESITDRMTLARTAVYIFLRHPVLGTGFNTFGAVQGQDPVDGMFAVYGNAHDNLLDLLADLGALGPIVLLLLLGAAVVSLLGWPPRPTGLDREWRLALAGAVGVMLVMGLTQTWLLDGRAAVFFWIVLLVSGTAPSWSPQAAAGSGNQLPTFTELRAAGRSGLARLRRVLPRARGARGSSPPAERAEG